jgi:hypothetical protein
LVVAAHENTLEDKYPLGGKLISLQKFIRISGNILILAPINYCSIIYEIGGDELNNKELEEAFTKTIDLN